MADLGNEEQGFRNSQRLACRLPEVTGNVKRRKDRDKGRNPVQRHDSDNAIFQKCTGAARPAFGDWPHQKPADGEKQVNASSSEGEAPSGIIEAMEYYYAECCNGSEIVDRPDCNSEKPYKLIIFEP